MGDEMSLAIRLGDATTSQQLLNVVTLKNPKDFPIAATVSKNGTVNIDSASLRLDELPDRGIWTIRVRFTDLSPWTSYTYSIVQDGKSIDGSFQTLPDNQTTPFSFIIGTCDGPNPTNPTNTYKTIRQVVENSTIPVLHMFIIDDVHYADNFTVDDPTTGFVSTGLPQDTGLAGDYAKSWAANYGLIPSEPKWMMPDRQWVYRNISCSYSGGDHAIASNWCRGDANPEGHDRMSKDCMRGPGSLEDVAGSEWDSFFGNINPDPLRAGQWYWGKEMGPVKMTLWDMSKTCEPFDSRLPTDTQCYGAQQISDHMKYLDVDTHPFKIGLHESGLTLMGQPWLEFHRTEAEAWYKDFITRPNLNGSNGSFVSIYGDNHTVHTLKLDDFWVWSPGTLGDARAVGGINAFNPDRSWGWGGIPKYGESSSKLIGDRFIHNFTMVTVHADKSPMYIDIAHIDGGRGVVKYSARLIHKSIKNQMVEL
ncbi:hypothetical protein EYC98_13155 [Halieaceae bacterium IMCC14734]|uniref:PhoD-like phosphatase metallophosphatase domain-containing protein n=1 Tax=Candidatus Litorirhabdus singularis TaxID=2518993 RepID=A0ABT3THK6_9GAMM|nr:hypothetical protein [Candidatus Litorirhabdus singularis]MCX2981807.1 hypothetical protein [Candidatus Litorirhabdus singularis]